MSSRQPIRTALSPALRASSSPLSIVATLFAAMALSQPAFAQGTDQNATNLGSVTVTSTALGDEADRSEQGKPRVLTTTIDAGTLRHLMIDDLKDVSRRLDASVNVRASNDSIAMRGLDSNRLLTTVDGIRQPWLTDGVWNAQGGVSSYDFNGLSAIDIVKSGDSSFFGTGAMGGVVALRTLDPADLLKEGKNFGGLSKATYDSTSHSLYLNQALAFRHKDTELLVQGGLRVGHEKRNRGEILGTGTTRTAKNPADYDQNSLLVKLYQNLGNGHRIGIAAETFNRDYTENTLTSLSSTYRSYATETENRRRRVSASYDYTGQGDTGVTQAHLIGYWQRTMLTLGTYANRATTPAGTYNRVSDLTSDQFGGTGNISFGAKAAGVLNTFTLSGELYGTRTKEYTAGIDSCTPAIFACAYFHTNQADMPNVHGTDLGVTLQDRIAFADNRIRITPAIRYDYFRRTPINTAAFQANDAYTGPLNGTHGDRWSPKVLGEVDVVPGITLYGQYAQAFRAPSATELYLLYGGAGSYANIGNPNLKPETSKGYEVGVKGGTAKRGFKLSYYDNIYHNFIDTITTTAAAAGISGNYPLGVFQYVNRTRVRIYGLEASAQYALDDHWRAWGSLAYVHGRDTSTPAYLNSIPPFKAILGVGYTGSGYGVDLTGTFAGPRRQVETPTSDLNKAPPYGLVDLSGWWEPSFLHGVKVQAGVFNLLNKTYYDALDIPDSSSMAKAYYSQPGRNAKVTATFQF
ncbi:TonB-dependent hemoglobin/transferrin/lactoferrin family receptor [Novosphingobium terrae]|uniref:TonB-dependent hemoglobin/transferrin/lactoferrin family receptor n=1 Tax=Novosphingobium terrae TaxID=2726189 RepID=UPI0019813720|nr:TonB-dependent hemoglobin/transferrin/lactoferrin family receptor [Novosphingobium terrae]